MRRTNSIIAPERFIDIRAVAAQFSQPRSLTHGVRPREQCLATPPRPTGPGFLPPPPSVSRPTDRPFPGDRATTYWTHQALSDYDATLPRISIPGRQFRPKVRRASCMLGIVQRITLTVALSLTLTLFERLAKHFLLASPGFDDECVRLRSKREAGGHTVPTWQSLGTQ